MSVRCVEGNQPEPERKMWRRLVDRALPDERMTVLLWSWAAPAQLNQIRASGSR